VATALVARSADIEQVHLLYFRSPFFSEADCVREAARAQWPAFPFRTQSLKKDYRRMANIPGRRHFSLRRSCLSCRALLLSRALRYMERIGADVVITGEVVGRNGLDEDDMLRVLQDAGGTGQILRPLSARLLPPTIAEISGAVPRSAMGDLVAENEEELIDLARSLDLPVGNAISCYERCRLTTAGYGARLEDLLREDRFTLNALKLLDFRLHYKLQPDIRVVLATDEEEKRALQNLFLPQDLRVYLPTHQGPMTLVRTEWEAKTTEEIDEIIAFACRVTATHSEASHLPNVVVCHRFEHHDETSQLNVAPFASIDKLSRRALLADTYASLV
jgi:hypothetical protein